MAKILGFLIGFTGSLWGAVELFLHFVAPLVPAGEYHGLLLFVVALTCLFFLGSLVVICAMAVGGLFAIAAEALTGGGK